MRQKKYICPFFNPSGRLALSTIGFHGVVIKTSFKKLKTILGTPPPLRHLSHRYGSFNYEWRFETKNGKPFTIYDYKTNKKLELNEEISWHISSHSRKTDDEVKEIIENELAKINPNKFYQEKLKAIKQLLNMIPYPALKRKYGEGETKEIKKMIEEAYQYLVNKQN